MSAAEEQANEILDQHARSDDPDNCTDEDRARAFGPNWRDAIAVIHQAVSLTTEQAERIANNPLAEWELDGFMEEVGMDEDGEVAPGSALEAWGRIADAGDEVLEPKYKKADVFWETRYAYLAALMAATAGDELSEDLSTRMTRVWRALTA